MLFYALIAAMIVLAGCTDKAGEKAGQRRVVPVVVDRAVQRNVPLQVRVIGNVDAYSSVSVRSQVGGVLVKVHFKEGQEVAKDDLLFTIDPRPYEVSLEKAKAILLRDVVLSKKAEEDVRRYTDLLEKDLVTKEKYDEIFSGSEALKATVKADQAAVESAKLDLEHCFITSPIEGKTGELPVKEGNLVKINDLTPLVVINQIHPVYVKFSIPEQNLAEIKKYMAQGQLKIESIITSSDSTSVSGILSFVDNEIDRTTGTILLKGTFENMDNALCPGQFVDVVLTLAESSELVIPVNAVETGQAGQFVFVLKEDDTVESRLIKTGRRSGNYFVVKTGLNAGETVVTDGQLQLIPGSKVSVKGGDDVK